MLEFNKVTKIFEGKGHLKTVANDQISFKISGGEIFGLLGHNGAGKTTIVNQVLGLLKSTAGDITLLGRSVADASSWARSVCSVQPQSQVPLGFLTPRQAVSLMGKMRAGKAFDEQRMNRLFAALDMEEWADTEGEKLSGGIQRLTAFCMAVIAPGKLVILDEPTNDVDPVRRRYLWDVIRELTHGGTSVLLVTHNVLEAEKAVDQVAILHKGKVLVQGTPSAIKKSADRQMRMDVTTMADKAGLNVPEWANTIRHTGPKLSFFLDPAHVPESIEWVEKHTHNGNVLDYSLSPATIEDVYVTLTSGKELIQA